MNKFLKFAFNLCVIALVVGICFWADSAMASDPFSALTTKASSIFQNTRKVVFVLGAFTLVALAVGAIFGKINWKWFVSLLVGLCILAIGGLIIKAFVNPDNDMGGSALS